jgi:hypothetical protein
MTNIETNEIIYELSHWYTSSESPKIAGKKINGYFKTREEAEQHHNDLLVKGLIKND